MINIVILILHNLSKIIYTRTNVTIHLYTKMNNIKNNNHKLRKQNSSILINKFYKKRRRYISNLKSYIKLRLIF